jgi:UDP-glucose 4-epimerase
MLERDLRVRLKYRFRPARVGDQPIYVTDSAKFTQHTGWAPQKDVRTIVQDICTWYKQNASLFAPAPFVLPAKPPPDLLREIAS